MKPGVPVLLWGDLDTVRWPGPPNSSAVLIWLQEQGAHLKDLALSNTGRGTSQKLCSSSVVARMVWDGTELLSPGILHPACVTAHL